MYYIVYVFTMRKHVVFVYYIIPYYYVDYYCSLSFCGTALTARDKLGHL